jgi:chemotaxis methyl-accepting protein methylase
MQESIHAKMPEVTFMPALLTRKGDAAPPKPSGSNRALGPLGSNVGSANTGSNTEPSSKTPVRMSVMSSVVAAMRQQVKADQKRQVEAREPRRLIAPTGWSTVNITSRAWIHNTAFFRDGPSLWESYIADVALFSAARAAVAEGRPLRVWSCGCSSGEELFTAQMIWRCWLAPVFGTRAPLFEGYGSDRDSSIIGTAHDEQYEWSEAALDCLPRELRDGYFEQAAAATSSSPATQFAFFDAEPAPRRFVLAQSARANCSFEVSDATVPCSDEGAKAASDGLFDIIFCRYSIFLYCSEDAARVALDAMMERLAPKGVLILGATDALPQGAITAHGLQRVKSLQHETREGTLRLEPNAWSRRMPVEGKELFAKDPRALPRVPSSDVDDGAREVAPACSSTSKGVGHLTTSDPAEALERSCTLREFRVNLGLSPRFALEEPPPPLLVSLSDRSIEILKASGNSSFYAKSLDSRAREYQRRRAERIDELQQEMRLAEEAELRRGLEEMHALQRAAMPKQLAEKLEARKPLVERLREEAALQEQRRRKMEEVTLAAIEARFGVSKSRGPRSKARRHRSQRDA